MKTKPSRRISLTQVNAELVIATSQAQHDLLEENAAHNEGVLFCFDHIGDLIGAWLPQDLEEQPRPSYCSVSVLLTYKGATLTEKTWRQVIFLATGKKRPRQIEENEERTAKSIYNTARSSLENCTLQVGENYRSREQNRKQARKDSNQAFHNALEAGDIGRRQLEVIRALDQIGGSATGRQAYEFSVKSQRISPSTNSFGSRLSELFDLGYLEVVDRKPCPITHRPARWWKLVQGPPVSRKKPKLVECHVYLDAKEKPLRVSELLEPLQGKEARVARMIEVPTDRRNSRGNLKI